jgi:hypothetical protein
MTPHEEHYPRRRDPDDGNNWGLPFLLGIFVITIFGVLALTSSS